MTKTANRAINTPYPGGGKMGEFLEFLESKKTCTVFTGYKKGEIPGVFGGYKKGQHFRHFRPYKKRGFIPEFSEA